MKLLIWAGGTSVLLMLGILVADLLTTPSKADRIFFAQIYAEKAGGRLLDCDHQAFTTTCDVAFEDRVQKISCDNRCRFIR